MFIAFSAKHFSSIFWYFNFFSRNCSTKLNSTTNPLHPHNATVYSHSTPASPNPLYTHSHSLLYIIHSIPSPLFFHFNPTCSNLTAVYNDLTILHPLFFFCSTLFNIGFTPIPLKFLLLLPFHLISILLWHITWHPDFSLPSLHFTLFYLIFLFSTLLHLHYKYSPTQILLNSHTLLVSNPTSL